MKSALLAVVAGLGLFGAQAAPAPDDGIEIQKHSDRLSISIGGEPFTDYVFGYATRPYFYPILGPGQIGMTRNWPMKETEGEEKDHPHHRSLWFAHGAVNGVDFWSEAKGAGRVIHKSFEEVKPGKRQGVIRTSNDWVDNDGKLICTDSRTMRIQLSKVNPSTRILDFEVTIKASESDIIFGDTKEGTMAIRLAETMKLKEHKDSQIVNSEGDKGEDTWGKQAKWCDYYGMAGGKLMGVAIFDHPSNPRHPTWWHVRDYGLFAANPFGKHDFEKLPNAKAGDLLLKKGSSVTFKYRFLFHSGSDQDAKVEQEYQDFVKDF